MNEEKQIANALIDAFKLREESYVENLVNNIHDDIYPGGKIDVGEYSRTEENCLQQACKQNGVSENLWYVLSLAFQWGNDLQDWCDHILKQGNLDGMFVVIEDIKQKDEICG